MRFLKIVGVLIGILLLTFVVGLVLAALGLSTHPSLALYALLASQLVMSIATYFIIRKKKKETSGEYVKTRGFTDGSWKMIFIGLATLGLGNLIISAVMKIFENTLLVQMSLDMVEQATAANNTLEQVIVFIAIVIIAPIMEEYLFRGYVFEETHKIYGVGLTIFLNGLLFGLYHMNLLQTVNTFILGMVLAAVYYYKQNITDAIIVHLVNNLGAMITAFFPQYAVYMGWVLIICIFIGAKFFYDIVKNK